MPYSVKKFWSREALKGARLFKFIISVVHFDTLGFDPILALWKVFTLSLSYLLITMYYCNLFGYYLYYVNSYLARWIEHV